MTDVPSKHVKIQKVAPVLKISAVLLLSRSFSNSFAFNCFNNYSSAGSPEALSLLKESVTTSYSFTRKSVLNSPCLLNNLLNTNVTRICMAKYCTSFSIKTVSVKLLKFSLDVKISILLSSITQEHKQEFVYKGLFLEKVEIGKPSWRCNAEITESTIIVRNGLQV